MADYGWIVNAKTHERVWEMSYENTYYAGGAQKNRFCDEIISLPKGEYSAYFVSDGSHSYNDWNDDPPFDSESWGISIFGVGDNFNPGLVTSFTEETETGVLVQLTKVKSGKHLRQKFTIDASQKVRIYSIGEADYDREMADYGWIEDIKTGEVVWEMTYRLTSHAGGGKKNRMFNKSVYLEKGEYEVHFKTDDSHAFGDWNENAPTDRFHYGITIYKE
jgi:hypothetical protein